MAVTTRPSEEIKKDVADQLYWDSRVSAAAVKVEVDDGRVRLSGTVPTYSARRAAQEDAWLVPGVRAVDNQLKVAYESDVQVPADAEISANLTNIIRWDADLENADIDASVTDGWVTLRGAVDAYWKKLRAEELASTLTGVHGVTNELAVVPSRSYEDKLIADSIMAALERTVHSEVEFINVQVNRGEVTLTGNVSSLPAFRATQQTAEYTPGVVAVNNELTIR
jgi:hyperosmotically inducible protein